MVDLGAIDEDVRFDHGAADTLASRCDAAADVIEGQAGSRASWKNTALTDFRGAFSELFRSNASVAAADATELASRLREVATGVRLLKEEARKEQQRRETARQWKREQDDRNLWDKGVDAVFGGDDPPVGPPAAEPTIPVSAPVNGTRETPTPGSGGGGGGGGTSSARPEDLRAFANGSRGANQTLSAKPAMCRSAYTTFEAGCGWGRLEASGVFTGFDKYLDANEEDVRWATLVADAFAAAGGEGAVSTLSDSALLATLQAAGVDASRQDIVIDPPTAYGHPPTTGYSVDPVNTATGNFLEREVDLSFTGATAALVWDRTYNSFSQQAGAFGPGWSSWTEAGLALDDEAARMTLPDGRVIVFPRLGTGWDRATGENMWLARDDAGLQATTNDGKVLTFDGAGRLSALSHGAGTTVRLEHDAGRLVRVVHERGRSVDLTWADERIVRATGSDGRTVDYAYDDSGRLVTAAGPAGLRSYAWDDAGLISSVTDADGVVEAENAYDAHRRVTLQRTPHGRVVRFVYLPGNVTVVSDEDGTRSNTWLHDQRGRLIGVVDTDERRQSTSYDAHGNPVMVTERDGSVTVHEYDDRGRRTRTVTPSGADLTYGYDEADRITTVVAESGGVVEYSYDGADRNPSLMVDPEGGRTRFSWRAGLLTEMVDPVGVTVRFDYDDRGDLVATTDALGNTARLERDPTGRVTASVSPLGHRTRWTYLPHGHLGSRQDPDGAVWRYEHTAAGRLSAVIDPTGSRTEIEHGSHGEETRTVDPLGRAVTRHLDDLGNLASVELPDGSRWEFTHDALSRLVAATDPAGAEWRYDYDANGDLTATTDPTGVRIGASVDRPARTLTVGDGEADRTWSFDPLGRATAATDPDGTSAVTVHDACGRPVELLDGDGGLTRIERDAAGRAVAVTSPTGAVTRFEYDARGRLAALVDPTGARTTYEHDADGRLVREVLPTGEVAWTEHDPCGRVTAASVPGRGVARYRYDAAGRVVESSDTWFGRRRFRYDAAGQLVEVVNGNGGVTRFERDPRGRAVAVTDPLGHTTRRSYDQLDRPVSQTDALGRTTRAGYDAAGRLAFQESPTGSRVEWTHDTAGRIASEVVDGRLVTSVEHDPRARTVRISDHTQEHRTTTHLLEWNRRDQLVRHVRDDRATTWAYDADGNRTSLTTPDGRSTTFERDAAGRVSVVEHPLLGRAVLERDGSGRLVRATADGTLQTWERLDGFVVAHVHTDAGGATRTEVTRDEDGRITGIDRAGERTTYAYDLAHQLVESRLGGSVTRWSYDAAGRLVTESVDGAVRGHTHDPAGQLLATRGPDGLTTRHDYDGCGRRVRTERPDGRVRELSWTATGWLSAVTERAGDDVERTELHVDATGQLAWVGDTELWWDTASPRGRGLLQVGEVPLLPVGAVTGVGEDWIPAGWRTGRGEGTDPWQAGVSGGPGRPVVPGLPAGLGIGAAGELIIGGVDPLEWLDARVYDPASRGFLSTDPLDPVIGAGWAGNPYSYAGNDPLHALDPTGLRPATDADLQAYKDANNGWVSENWEYLVGGAMVIGGGIMIATGFGGPVGMALVAAGADTIIQKATTGEVNWGQVAVSGGLGLVGGAGAAWATRASVNGTAALRTTMLVNGGVNAAGAEAAYVINNRGNLTWQGAVGAGAGGFVSGAIGGAAGPSGGTLATQLGQRSTSLTAHAATGGVNFFGGFSGSVVNQTINGQPVNYGQAALSGGVNTATGAVSSVTMPSGSGMTTLNQTSYFGPRTVSGAFNLGGTNTQSMYLQGGAGAAQGATYDVFSD
ncbi:DUF6531 domain-containing protein [Nocardioides euryhalodurans]|uniref:Type IV secretion protein Rhs n=1 Tax=Nocardioides euryhalodurans TaxID=2518370 RepID=A0A4P7GLW9_9ACTN|nr:DUF6531 domain-containing protein [Nocardioides euryhalodurans]QBR92879.1 type IV secretion protein Rhs [Nocardioides euryhalodurans]